MASTLKQLRDDALTYLVLWAASKEYSPDIEAALKLWATTFEIPEAELMDRIVAASTGKLTRPDPSVAAAGHDSQPTAGPASATTVAAGAALEAAFSTGAAVAEQQQQQAEAMQVDR